MLTFRISKDKFEEKYTLGEVLQGEKPSLKTTVSACYTKDALRFYIECETDKPLVADYEGDFVPVWKGDVVEVFVCPYGDERWYYELDVAPNGSNFHARIYNPNDAEGYARGIDTDGLVARSVVKEGSWTVEMEVPFALILKEEDIARVKELPWRGNIYRIDCGNDEYLSLAPTKKENINFHVPSAFAKWELE
ncbi:MAG: carbohydrate-binding family 9-like protein [Clostridia bacterium]|nr:carbohydrate-binding family 9-like protein [Clostridia bacterium]